MDDLLLVCHYKYSSGRVSRSSWYIPELFQWLSYATQTDRDYWRTSLAAVSGIKTAVQADTELLLSNVAPPMRW